jgi:hypothetical protein
MRCHPPFKVIYELMQQKLSRDNADQSHVVLDPDGSALAKLFQKHGHGGPIENAIAPYLLGGKELLHVLARSGLEKTARFRRPVGLLVSFGH